MRDALRSSVTAALVLSGLILAERNALADGPACTSPKTTCSGHSGYYASSDDLNRLTAVADPILRDVRTCLDGAGGKHVGAVLVMRWNSEGAPVEVRVDAPGYESLPCVQKAQTKLSNLQNPHETAIRCEYGCPKPAPPPAPVAAPPAVVAPTPPPSATGTGTAATGTERQIASAPPPVPPPQPKHYEKTWYGYQTLIADAITIPSFFAGVATETRPLTAAGYVGFLLVTPIIHMTHGNVGKGFGSLGIRLAGPPTAALVGILAALIVSSDNVTSSKTGDAVEAGAWIGAGAGAVGTALLDAFAFGYEKNLVEGPPPQESRRRAPTFAIAPSFATKKDGATVGVMGQF